MPRKADFPGTIPDPGGMPCSGHPIASVGDTIVVSQRHRHFHPDTLTITRGTVVHFINDDRVTHHVYVDSSAVTFDSGEQPVGTKVDLESDHPGTIRCCARSIPPCA